MSISQLQPNNVPAALAWYRSAVEAGAFKPEHGEQLMMLQTTTEGQAELRAGMAELMRNPVFRAKATRNQQVAPPRINPRYRGQI